MGRRAIGLVAAVLMANATLVNTAFACASAPAAASVEHQMDGHSGAHPAHHAGGGAPVHHGGPCDTPDGARCCGALAPCATSLARAAVLDVSAPPTTAGRVAAPPTVAPASRVTSPDPPPPKA